MERCRNRLEQLRIERGLTIKQLSIKSGVSVSQIKVLQKHQSKMRKSTRALLAGALGVSPEYLTAQETRKEAMKNG